jgi:hypothetical protein
LLAVVALAMAILTFAWAVTRPGGDQQRRADEAIRQYAHLVESNDFAGADAMLCGGDDTNPARLDAGFRDWPEIASLSVVVPGKPWSSVVDGHGWDYPAQVGFADGSTGTVRLRVEIIGDEPCIGSSVPHHA